jgi:hypothetical protein
MNKSIITLLLILVFSIFAQGDEILIKKWFRNNNTFVIVCKGYPKEGLTGDARVESAKEAALINAQFISRALFNESVDIFKYGTIEKYSIYNDYVVVYYVIEMNNLRRQMR